MELIISIHLVGFLKLVLAIIQYTNEDVVKNESKCMFKYHLKFLYHIRTKIFKIIWKEPKVVTSMFNISISLVLLGNK